MSIWIETQDKQMLACVECVYIRKIIQGECEIFGQKAQGDTLPMCLGKYTAEEGIAILQLIKHHICSFWPKQPQLFVMPARAILEPGGDTRPTMKMN